MESGRKKTFVWLTALLYVITALHVAALYFFWYWSIWWYDILMHTLGGVWVGGVALFLFSTDRFSGFPTRVPLFQYILPFLIVVAVGFLWESYEFSVDTLIAPDPQNDLLDTVADMGADVVGALLASLIFIRGNKQTQ